MLDDNILEDVTIEDMPNNDMRLVAESCGIEVAVSLMQNVSGIQLSIPKFGFKRLIERYIAENYDGHNARELAVRLDVTERFIFKTLRKKGVGKYDQLNFLSDFDER